MTYVVTDYCVKCRYTDCAVVCPVEAFHLLADMMVINPDICIDCDACVPECPVKAIYPADQVPEKWKHYIQYNADQAKLNPVFYQKLEALPTAKTFEELEQERKE